MEKSPLTGGSLTEVKRIKTAAIAALYAPYVNVAKYFKGLDEIIVYECTDTGYQFYYPFHVAGDGHFYEVLGEGSLYYIPWKDEHTTADQYIREGDTVLEIGCANGDFLIEEVKRKHIHAYGTELNETAKATAKARGTSFEPVAHADVTCAFQVLEHLHDVHEFFTSAITATKPGGYIIVGIPNNDSFIKDDPTCFLNMPPHHMGLWRHHSLTEVARFFNLTVKEIKTECLQPHHYRYYYQVAFGDKLRPLGFLGKVINKIIFECFARWVIKFKAPRIIGHTIVAVYQTPTTYVSSPNN